MSIDNIVDIFRRVLNTSEVGTNSDFFELGVIHCSPPECSARSPGSPGRN